MRAVDGEALVLIGEEERRWNVGGLIKMVGRNVDEAWKAMDGCVVPLVIRTLVERAVIQFLPRVGL